eukprot:5898201-Pyramimonas_sp.AAC.1
MAKLAEQGLAGRVEPPPAHLQMTYQSDAGLAGIFSQRTNQGGCAPHEDDPDVEGGPRARGVLQPLPPGPRGGGQMVAGGEHVRLRVAGEERHRVPQPHLTMPQRVW